MRVPVTVVTGFLGAGKTTLVNHWLTGVARGDVAVIVNEVGDVGIDGELLAARAKELVEITGGCVCCATQAELVRALDDLASRTPTPARILVETSGAASPAGVVSAIARGGRDEAFALDGVITVADASRIDGLAGHELAYEQLGYADIIVLSRADTCRDEVLAHAASRVAGCNAAALVLAASRGVVSPAGPGLEALLDARRADFTTPHAVPPRAADHPYESVSLVVDGALDDERFADFMETDLASVAGRLFRIKGILAIDGLDERMIVQGVGDTVEVTFGEAWRDAPRRSRLVIVGFGLDRGALGEAFAACAV